MCRRFFFFFGGGRDPFVSGGCTRYKRTSFRDVKPYIISVLKLTTTRMTSGAIKRTWVVTSIWRGIVQNFLRAGKSRVTRGLEGTRIIAGGGGGERYLIGILAVIRARFGNSSLDCEITFNDIFGALSPRRPPPPRNTLYSSSPPYPRTPPLPCTPYHPTPPHQFNTRPPQDGEGLQRAQYKSLVTRSEQMCFRTYSE